ncbi:tetratricopeptide repeat protein, partial [Butyricimonas virosa]
MVKILITMIAAVVISLPSAAQQERKFIRGGNDLFNKQDFEKAEVEYRKALDTEVKSYEGAFNLGDALYKQKKFDEALQQFQSLAQNEKDKEKLGELYHNIGNTLLAMNKLDESIEAYKQSLRNRPNSQETKYNLEFARKQKQDQQNQDQN